MDIGTLATVLGTGVAVNLLNWAITENVVAGSIADVRVEMATLTTKVDERLGFLREDYAKTVEEMRGIVEAGLAERTNEVGRAMIAMGENDNRDWIIRIANVPAGSEVAEKMDAIAREFGATTFAIGGTLNYEVAVGSLTEEKAMLVQQTWDAAADPEIGIKVFPSSDESSLPDAAKP